MVPKSDFFDSTELHPGWSFIGYTPDSLHSLTDRPGWLRLSPKSSKANTVIKNDGEHSYSLIAKVDFDPESTSDEAGLWIFNGPETHYAKVFSTVNGASENVLVFSFEGTSYEVENTIGDTVWLKLIRTNHMVSGFYSSDGINWTRIGYPINAAALDAQYDNFNNFTGNQQGLYVQGKRAFFDLYIYRDAYTNIAARHTANRSGVSRSGGNLVDIHNDDWAMYAGVEFGGNADYPKVPTLFGVIASSENDGGGAIEVWLDSIDTGNKVAECSVSTTGDWDTFEVFTSDIDSVSGRHDVYLKFTGEGTDPLFRLQWLKFLIEGDSIASTPESSSQIPNNFILGQNHPNPFVRSTDISFGVPSNSFVSLKVYNLLGQEVAVLAEKEYSAGMHTVTFDASRLPCGMYFYAIKVGDTAVTGTKKMILVR
jgi:hypothetical protein